MTKTLSKNDSNFTKLLSKTITVIGYILAFLGFIFNLGAIFGTIWITDPNYNGYPFANNNWEVTVQAYLVLSTIFSSAGFLAERLIGLSNGGQALKCSIGSSWFCSFICMTVAIIVIPPGGVGSVGGSHSRQNYYPTAHRYPTEKY